MNSAGTVSSSGLLIGVEMNARSESTPVDELKAWERASTGQIATLPHIVAHELIHIQQPPERDNATLLQQALREGAADFVGKMISGEITNKVQHNYGDVHERELWVEFRKEMLGTDINRWMYQGPPCRPGILYRLQDLRGILSPHRRQARGSTTNPTHN
jgi:hypothetical protein